MKKHIFQIVALCIVCINLIGCSAEIKYGSDIQDGQEIINQDISGFDDIYSDCIAEELIYAKSYIDPQAIIDLSDTQSLYDTSDLVVVGSVFENGGGKMIDGFDYALTLGKIEVGEVIKGSFPDEFLEFYVIGGYCTICEYIDAVSKNRPEKISRLGLNQLTDYEKSQKYLVFNYKYGKNFQVGQKYLLMLKKTGDNYVCYSNYGFLELDSNTSVDKLIGIPI